MTPPWELWKWFYIKKLRAIVRVPRFVEIQMLLYDYFLPLRPNLLYFIRLCFVHRVHTEWQWPLSGVHPISMEKLAQPGEGGVCTSTPFHCIYHHVESCGVCSAQRPDTLPLFLLYPYMYSVVSSAALQISLCQRMKGLNPRLLQRCTDNTWLYHTLSTASQVLMSYIYLSCRTNNYLP